MRVWVDQEMCTGSGMCEAIAPDVFVLLDDGLSHVKDADRVYARSQGNPQGADGVATVPADQLELVVEAAQQCPGMCIHIEA
ncbi:MAG: ferredoxin [Actinobacteria bacterium]|nr:MAG: ferredoxin [Actinomycetota bacterium]REK38002.1 MAG: ferredoxin [Actinomycetota bacterium]